jgi:urea carboxylase-associated protein 2
MSRPFDDVSKTDEVLTETLPPGAYWSGVVSRGRTLRLTDIEGSGGVALLAYNADDPTERYNAADTVKVQNQIFLTTGMVVLSDMGRVLLSVTTDDAHGHHDTLSGASSRGDDSDRFGPGIFQELRNNFHRNAHDNFLMALGHHGLERRDLMPNLNLFDRVEVASDGALNWVGPCGDPGTVLELRAELNVLVVISNTPHPLDPATHWSTGPLGIAVIDGDPAGLDDPCRTRIPEIGRAFDNTDRYWSLQPVGAI